MKRILIVPSLLCLAVGLLLGGLLPMPWDADEPDPAPTLSNTLLPTPSSSQKEGVTAQEAPQPLDTGDNFTLLSSASYVVQALQTRDYSAVAALVHPELGVTLTPYSTVDPDADVTLTQAQVRSLAQDDTVYTWGVQDGSGAPISLTPLQYFEQFVFDADYTKASLIGIDQIMLSGNALENLTEAYPGCRFVDFSIPGQDGMDWSSLKLVFQAGDTSWYLVGVVHGQWTI